MLVMSVRSNKSLCLSRFKTGCIGARAEQSRDFGSIGTRNKSSQTNSSPTHDLDSFFDL